ncbi:MAG: hypothetical protein Q7T97_17095 [Burkholderiaceae bacterium]|nr:hypothetical protein [Burkholderiaceae bacterium]
MQPKTCLVRRFATLWLLSLCGCSALLPKGQSEELSPFSKYDDARSAFVKVTPYSTTLSGLKELGFDAQASTNVREIAYPQFMSLVAESPYLPMEQLDVGIRDCISAGARCRAYVFQFGHQSRNRTGSFWLDFFNFYRVTHTSGWRFQGVVLVRDDNLVLFRNHSGEPNIEKNEVRRNPLGPLQSFGETVP